MKYVCQTLFDITATGTTGHCKSSHMPFYDRSGRLISDSQSWHRSRNQQRNWETLTQILGLRAQLFNLTDPVPDQTGTKWMFEFETEISGVYGPDSDPVAVLRADAAGVPMLGRIGSSTDTVSVLVTTGADQNIWFASLPINT
jgi:hypothetical protein